MDILRRGERASIRRKIRKNTPIRKAASTEGRMSGNDDFDFNRECIPDLQ